MIIIIIIIIITLFQEDNIFGRAASLTYGPQYNIVAFILKSLQAYYHVFHNAYPD